MFHRFCHTHQRMIIRWGLRTSSPSTWTASFARMQRSSLTSSPGKYGHSEKLHVQECHCRMENRDKAEEYTKKHSQLREAIHAVLHFDSLWHDYNIVTGYDWFFTVYNAFTGCSMFNIASTLSDSTQADSTRVTLPRFTPTVSHPPSTSNWLRLKSFNSTTPSLSLVGRPPQL